MINVKGGIEIFKLVVLADLVRVPPNRFGEPLEKVVEEILKVGYEYRGRTEGGYEGKLDKELGIVLAITEIQKVEDGSVIPGDGAAYHNTVFEALVFKPELQEILDSEVVEIVEFGAFVRFGPLDGLIHVSQITDDYIVYDKKRMALVGKESGRALEVGNKVRARAVAISLNPERSKESKINFTMRQPGLGRYEWLDEERHGKRAPRKKEEGKEKERGKGKAKGVEA